MLYGATRSRPSTSAPTDGSRTIVLHDSQPREEGRADEEDVERDGESDSHTVGVLVLRGGPRSRPRVQWTEDVVDNEGMGKKKSKICCIYHKPKRFDESSDESSSSSDSDSDCGYPDHHHRRPTPRKRRPNDGDDDADQSVPPQNGASRSNSGQSQTEGGGAELDGASNSDSNAYEKLPVAKQKRKKGQSDPISQ